ncbi:MAG: hypothetical protein A2233_04205 [Candidatus Kerfeldbacteria bacterium RIFOXYA2_FULL_38_24]|nr:MAG: hypothetical protein A2233_04205 [Candidatus Kerfeldbacteria bacterium RIFOXYA2_FULL_38_24]OGY89928.1 MAG: hypothetical protein A2458_05050 [Candidatus Kerfeldbacteria bacterium RIFOXYC2_FULL_38_9]
MGVVDSDVPFPSVVFLGEQNGQTGYQNHPLPKKRTYFLSFFVLPEMREQHTIALYFSIDKKIKHDIIFLIKNSKKIVLL